MATYLNRRDFFRRVAGGTAAISGWPLFAMAGKARKKRFNVLLIIGDDLRPQLGCYGERQMVTPNVDRLAAQGVVFERSYCQYSVCAPSRASLLTGLRPDSTKIYDMDIPVSRALPDRITLPGHFKRNGFETISVGKVYHHLQDDPAGWSRAPFLDKLAHYASEEGRESVKTNQRLHPELRWPIGNPTEAADVPDRAYRDGRLTETAISELQRLKDKPFLLCVGLSKPHLPFAAPKRYWDLYDPGKLELTPNPSPPRNGTLYSLRKYWLQDYLGMPAGDEPIAEEQTRHLIHGYHACVSFLDAQVGHLLTALDRLALRDRTIVILWGDNGFKLGEHGSWGKNTNFESDTRVPLIVSVPGMKAAGQHTEALVEAVDVFPSLCELCGLEPPGQFLEGTSFAPLLREPGRPWKKAAFSQSQRGNVMGHAMRTERYRYIEWRDTASGNVMARELYDHDKDPHEDVNVVAEAPYAGALRELETGMRSGWKGALPEPVKRKFGAVAGNNT